MLIEKTGLIDYPPFIHECAVYIGKLRDLYNYDMNEEAERFKRGDRSEYVNILGVKGELIYSYFLQSKGIKHDTAKLLSNRPVSSWDIKIKGVNKKIDVKRYSEKDNAVQTFDPPKEDIGSGTNFHYGLVPQGATSKGGLIPCVGGYSAGCQVIPTQEQWNKFWGEVKSANQKEFMYSIIEEDKI